MDNVTMTSSEFDEDSKAARHATRYRPLVVPDHGPPPHVLMTWEDYRRLSQENRKTIAQAIALPGVENIAFNPPCFDERPEAAAFE